MFVDKTLDITLFRAISAGSDLLYGRCISVSTSPGLIPYTNKTKLHRTELSFDFLLHQQSQKRPCREEIVQRFTRSEWSMDGLLPRSKLIHFLPKNLIGFC